jgi:tetratricopeptide (TPR) repeat protein
VSIRVLLKLRGTPTAAFVAAVAALFISAPANVTTQQEGSWCNDATREVGLQIKGCTALIQSGQWSEKYVAFAYNIRGNAYQANGDFDRAIADYSDAIRLDPVYVFAHFDRSNEYRSTELETLGLRP